MRTSFNDKYGRADNAQLDDLELNLGNLCNLKCRMCNSNSSSRWIADDMRGGKTDWITGQPPQLVRRTAGSAAVDLGSLSVLKLIGGEPAMEQDAIRQILDGIAASRSNLGHLRISIHTNGTVLLESDVLQRLRTCGRVLIYLSMDNMGARNDFQRSGGSWAETATNAQIYHSLTSDSWQLLIQSTPGIYTIRCFTDLVDWVTDQLPLAKHVVIPIVYPEQQRLSNMPDAYKQQMLEQLAGWKPLPPPARPSWLPKQCTAPDYIRNILCWYLAQPRTMPVPAVRRYLDNMDAMQELSLADHDPQLWAMLRA